MRESSKPTSTASRKENEWEGRQKDGQSDGSSNAPAGRRTRRIASYLFQHDRGNFLEVLAQQLVEHEHNTQHRLRLVVRLMGERETC